jgi:hypothetical protein
MNIDDTDRKANLTTEARRSRVIGTSKNPDTFETQRKEEAEEKGQEPGGHRIFGFSPCLRVSVVNGPALLQ